MRSVFVKLSEDTSAGKDREYSWTTSCVGQSLDQETSIPPPPVSFDEWYEL